MATGRRRRQNAWHYARWICTYTRIPTNLSAEDKRLLRYYARLDHEPLSEYATRILKGWLQECLDHDRDELGLTRGTGQGEGRWR